MWRSSPIEVVVELAESLRPRIEISMVDAETFNTSYFLAISGFVLHFNNAQPLSIGLSVSLAIPPGHGKRRLKSPVEIVRFPSIVMELW